MDRINAYLKAGWTEAYGGDLPHNPAQFFKTWVGTMKDNDGQVSVKNKYSERTDKLIIRPTLGTRYYGFKLFTDDSDWQSAVFTQTGVNSFEIIGY